MKRAVNLYDDIYELNNLYLAYYKASKGKRSKNDVIRFSKSLDKNLLSIQSQLIKRDVKLGDYHYFTINDPKRRLICAASFPERIIHHAIMNVTDVYFDNFQIYDSYACRVDKGTHKAIHRAFSMCKNYKYYIKLDIKKYFDSIDHEILYSLLLKRFKDNDLLNLFSNLIDTYKTSPGKGIPIGNLTSQYFANYYLAYFDRYVKEELKIKDYLRYMDDFIIFVNEKSKLMPIVSSIAIFLCDTLSLELKPPLINSVSSGIPFLGFKLYKHKIFLSKRSKKRFKDKFISYESNYENGLWDIDELSHRVLSLISFTKTANARNLRNLLLNKFGVISH